MSPHDRNCPRDQTSKSLRVFCGDNFFSLDCVLEHCVNRREKGLAEAASILLWGIIKNDAKTRQDIDVSISRQYQRSEVHQLNSPTPAIPTLHHRGNHGGILAR